MDEEFARPLKAVGVSVRPNKEGGWGWVVVFGSFMIHAIIFGILFSCGLFYIEFQKEFEEEKGQIALLGTIAPGITHLIGMFVSSMTNRFGYRKITILGAIVTAVGFILSSFATEIYHLYITFGILPGFGMGMMYVPAIVMVNLYFESRRSFAVGLAVCGAGVGTFIFALLTRYMIDMFEWRGAALIEAGILLNCVLGGALFRPITRGVRSMDYEKIYLSRNKMLEQEIQVSEYVANDEQVSNTTDEIGRPLQRINNDLVDLMVDEHVSSDQQHDTAQAHTFRYCSQFVTEGGDCSDNQLKLSELYDEAYLEDKTTNYSTIYCESENTSSISHSGVKHQSIDQSQSGSCHSTRICQDGQNKMKCRFLDSSLFSNGVFVLFCFSNMCLYFGYITPALLLPHHAQENGISAYTSAILVSVMGVSSTVGRIVFGWLADRPTVNRLMLYKVSVIICGVAISIIPTSNSAELMFCCAAVFGLFAGSSVCLTSVILVDLFGIRKLNRAFGMVTMCEGVGLLIGPPIQGLMHDIYGTYNISFYITGSVVAFSGAILFTIPWIRKCQKFSTRNSGIEVTIAVDRHPIEDEN